MYLMRERRNNLKEINMIRFIQLPNNAMLMICEPDMDTLNQRTRIVIEDYKPATAKTVSQIDDSFYKPSFIESKFAHLRIKSTDQYRPADELVNFMNTCGYTRGTPVPLFADPDFVKEAHPPTKKLKTDIYMTRKMNDDLLIEGCRQSVSPTDITVEVMDFYLSIRHLVNSKQNYDDKVESFVRYITRPI